jgi:hypothetical protein
MSDAESPPLNAEEKAAEAKIEADLNTFNRHRKELLHILRKAHERGLKKRGLKTEPFDDDKAWRSVEFIAWAYLKRDVQLKQEKAWVSDADRLKLLGRLEAALSKARLLAAEAMRTGGGRWFAEWAEAHGNPDFTDPRIHLYEDEFDKRVAVLKDLEEAAFRAVTTERDRKKRGRPPDKATLPHDFILTLERVYRDRTKSNAGAGSGPFARFVTEFLGALGRECADETVIEAIQTAKKREEKHPATSRWGRDSWAGFGGKNPVCSQ